MRKYQGKLVFSPSDLNRFLASPFASWMDRYALENPGVVTPDKESEDLQLIAKTGDEHEKRILAEYQQEKGAGVVVITRGASAGKGGDTWDALRQKPPVIYQAALEAGRFAGFVCNRLLFGFGLRLARYARANHRQLRHDCVSV